MKTVDRKEIRSKTARATQDRAALYDSTVTHVRGNNPPYSFTHRMYLWLVDLDELPRLPRWLRPFATFDGRDHFSPGDNRSIRAKLDLWLSERGIDLRGGKVRMLASARVLGYVFNPITVYWCHDKEGTLVCVVAEVHNTYRGRHAYLLDVDAAGTAQVDKAFYVSPFQEVAGEYRMRLPQPDSLLSLTVALRQGEHAVLTATLRGVRQPVTAGKVVRMVVTRPLMPQRISLLIRKHGIVLWAKRARIAPRGLRDSVGDNSATTANSVEGNLVEGELNERTSAAA